MHTPLEPAHVCGQELRNDRLHDLVIRVAAGNRPAFRTLYSLMAMRVWRDAVRLLPPGDARAVTRSTFVEVWHLARHHLGHEAGEIGAWVQAIAARHIDDRIRLAGERSLHCDSYDDHMQCELVALLGTGQATVRTGPSAFARVVDLAP